MKVVSIVRPGNCLDGVGLTDSIDLQLGTCTALVEIRRQVPIVAKSLTVNVSRDREGAVGDFVVDRLALDPEFAGELVHCQAWPVLLQQIGLRE